MKGFISSCLLGIIPGALVMCLVWGLVTNQFYVMLASGIVIVTVFVIAMCWCLGSLVKDAIPRRYIRWLD